LKIYKLLSFLLLSISCISQNNLEEYLIDDDGICIEKPDSTKTYDKVYNSNNNIYKIGKTITYSYYYENKKGEKFLIKKGKDILQPEGYSISDWEFINIEKQDNETVNKIILKVSSGNTFKDFLPDYNQTSISYEYSMNNGNYLGKETTGAIENEANIWIHPPRSNFFGILEINPFPYIKSPLKIGSQWSWKLEIGDSWSDKRWLEWKGSILNHYKYEIIGKSNIITKLGNLECYIVKAEAESRIGKTELIAYFNSEFGFIKLEYTNIDETKLILDIEKTE
jgi:hypothetical protein